MLFRSAVMQGASDIHFCSGQSPWMRVQGELFKTKYGTQTQQYDQNSDELLNALNPYIDTHLGTRLSQGYEIDFSFTLAGLGRFRANVFKSHKGIGAVLRHIRDAIPTLAEINTPKVLPDLLQGAGLFLVTGATGSGKSTTLAAILQQIGRAHV